VIDAYRFVVGNARKAGFDNPSVLVQPMERHRRGICRYRQRPNLGGDLLWPWWRLRRNLQDTTTEMAPLSHDDALRAIHRIRRCRFCVVRAVASPAILMRWQLSLFALVTLRFANAGRFRTLDLNPVIVKPAGQGVVAVDIVIEVFLSPMFQSDN